MNTETKPTKKLTLITTPITTPQLLRLSQRTPTAHRYSRPAKGGGTWEYVTGVYVKQVLNEVFGWLWSFEIISMKETHGQAICQGKLIINKPDGQPLVWKMDIGKADIKIKKDTGQPLDYGNDEKAATTDCLKRCAFQLGIASDIYGKNEFRDIANEFLDSLPKPAEKKVEKTKLVESKIKIDELRGELK
jgi:hypothetical protein